jgi:hypothetical protein
VAPANTNSSRAFRWVCPYRVRGAGLVEQDASRAASGLQPRYALPEVSKSIQGLIFGRGGDVCDGDGPCASVRVREKQVRAALAGLSGIGPKDELEGMMAAQLVTAHNA